MRLTDAFPNPTRRAPAAAVRCGAMLALVAAAAAMCVAPARAGGAPADDRIEQARRALDALARKVPWFHIVPLPPRGEIELKAGDSLTIDDLRGTVIDDDPPASAEPAEAYHPHMADDCPPDARPYVARGIAPFRFRHFNCEFNYGGWHNYNMQDYAALHGFNIMYPYTRTAAQTRHWPKNTLILSCGSFIDWDEWLAERGLGAGRYDRLVGLDLVRMHLDAGLFAKNSDAGRPQADALMIDMEHGFLPPDQLRRQPWYPADGDSRTRRDFEKRYYDGYSLTCISSVLAARRQGWNIVGIYGWSPFERTWHGLENASADLGEHFAWNAFGRRILDVVSVVHNSVYCFYWSPRNVAYVLANIDLNMKMVRAADPGKPVRPYFWTLLHGGGEGQRWWREQPLPDEEQRAMTAMAFFTGIDGIVCWNWSGTGSHHTVALRTNARRKVKDPNGDPWELWQWEHHHVMVDRPFRAADDVGNQEHFRRYDVLEIVAVDDTQRTARFRRAGPAARPAAASQPSPVEYTMPADELVPLLRPKSAPVAAMIEGMALVKPLEYLLRHGQVMIDVSAQHQFAQTLPVVRRVRLGPWHVLATYDPAVVHGGVPRQIVLEDFDGVRGRKLRLPADAQTRIFVLEERSGG